MQGANTSPCISSYPLANNNKHQPFKPKEFSWTHVTPIYHHRRYHIKNIRKNISKYAFFVIGEILKLHEMSMCHINMHNANTNAYFNIKQQLTKRKLLTDKCSFSWKNEKSKNVHTYKIYIALDPEGKDANTTQPHQKELP